MTQTADIISQNQIRLGELTQRRPSGSRSRGIGRRVRRIAALLGARMVWARRGSSSAPIQLGPYSLGEKIGEGGMGVVYRARHALLPRPVAIKVLPPARASERNRQRFEREVRLTSLLTHPNTVTIHESGCAEDGTLYYAMEYLDGQDLQRLVETHGPQSPARVARWLAELCGALSEAHGLGLIHRDVKPANLVTSESNDGTEVLKIVDFGLVQDRQERTRADPSGAGELLGTPLYLSPEAITSPESVDERSDLYAVGAVGYFLLTGSPPFTGKSLLEVCAQHLYTPAVPPSKRVSYAVPAELEALILSCLEKSPSRRPSNAATMRAVLLPLADRVPGTKLESVPREPRLV